MISQAYQGGEFPSLIHFYLPFPILEQEMVIERIPPRNCNPTNPSKLMFSNNEQISCGIYKRRKGEYQTTYFEYERVRTLRSKFFSARGFEYFRLVFHRISKNTNQRFPHVPIERITDKD
jgi:hypothetical protein